MKKSSKKSARTLAILWTVVALIWSFLAISRFTDPAAGGGTKLLNLLVMALALALAMAHWYRYTHLKDDEE